jgi:hypothetical protein
MARYTQCCVFIADRSVNPRQKPHQRAHGAEAALLVNDGTWQLGERVSSTQCVQMSPKMR